MLFDFSCMFVGQPGYQGQPFTKTKLAGHCELILFPYSNFSLFSFFYSW